MNAISPLPKSKILYLDTSDTEAELAIFDGPKKITGKKWLAGRELALTLTQKYQELLAGASLTSDDLAGVGVFVGPGSFTGLRIGISFVNGLAYALGVPVHETRERGRLDLTQPKKIAQPFYGSEPKITQPKPR